MSNQDERARKWMNVHGTLKTMVHTIVSGVYSSAGYVLKYNDIDIITSKNQIKSLNLRRLWSAWDIAFDRWMKELNLPAYRESKTYDMMVKARNLATTIMDNDGAYIKLLYQFQTAWAEVQLNDKYIEDEEESK